jgi:type II secretory pathway component PulF
MTPLTFRFRAAHRSGFVEIGSIAAESREAASAALAARGVFPLEIGAASVREQSGIRLPASEMAMGFRVLATLLGSGLTVARSLAALEELVSPRWRSALPAIRESVRAGRSLGAALRTSGIVLPPAVIGIVEAGEAGSGLAPAVARAADLAEREAAVRAALRGALAYPALLAFTGAASLGVLVTIVLPRFAEILGELDQALPASTQFVLSAAAVLRAAMVPSVVGASILWIAWRAWVATASGREVWDQLLLRLPGIGNVRRAAGSARVALALSALLSSGVPIATALTHAARAAGNAAIAARLRAARTQVISGERISRAIAATSALTPTIERLIRAGEESGELAPMLAHAAAIEADRSERAIRSIVGLLEPALILGFGGLVAFIAAALLQAVYAVRPA